MSASEHMLHRRLMEVEAERKALAERVHDLQLKNSSLHFRLSEAEQMLAAVGIKSPALPPRHAPVQSLSQAALRCITQNTPGNAAHVNRPGRRLEDDPSFVPARREAAAPALRMRVPADVYLEKLKDWADDHFAPPVPQPLSDAWYQAQALAPGQLPPLYHPNPLPPTPLAPGLCSNPLFWEEEPVTAAKPSQPDYAKITESFSKGEARGLWDEPPAEPGQ